jgi:hypothetical protein
VNLKSGSLGENPTAVAEISGTKVSQKEKEAISGKMASFSSNR